MSSLRFLSPLVKDVALWHQRAFDGLRVAARHRAGELREPLFFRCDALQGVEDRIAVVDLGMGGLRLNRALMNLCRQILDRMAMGSSDFIKYGSSDRDPSAGVAYRFMPWYI
jgi:hypothetical protein